MDKEEIFSKIQLKDYNNKLEKILEKKSFPEGAKNLFLNMFYRIEASYEDYSKVKVNTKTKKELLEEILQIIENECNEIEIIKPKFNEESIPNNKQSIIIQEEKKIIVYPNEKLLLSSIYSLQAKNFKVLAEYELIKKPMEEMLNTGYKTNIIEIIRDFDGWSWNVLKQEIQNIEYNIIYQNLRILVGELFLQNWRNAENSNDYIFLLKGNLEEKYGEELGKNLYKTIFEASMYVYSQNSNEEKRRVLYIKENMSKQLSSLGEKQSLYDIKNKVQLEENIELINELEENTSTQQVINELQSKFIDALIINVENANNKKNIVDLIYTARYCKFLMNTFEDIEESIKLKFEGMFKLLITKACKVKAIIIVSYNIEENYEVISRVLSTKIIDLNSIVLEVSSSNTINIYEENILDKTIECNSIKHLKIKRNKNIKLFV